VKRKVDPSSGDELRQASSLERIRAAIPELDQALETGDVFADMIRRSIAQHLAEWMAKAAGCGEPGLANFAAHLKSDQDAVKAALTKPWSNGPVEVRSITSKPSIARCMAAPISIYWKRGCCGTRKAIVKSNARHEQALTIPQLMYPLE
jgi:transposase